MAALRVIDWFAGVGGFHRAFSAEGHRIVGACEINPFCRKVYTKNFGAPAWFPKDIQEVVPDEIPDADLWVAGSPCQGFSHAGQGLGFDDPRSGLLRRLLFLIAKRRPRFFLLENVPGILSANDGNDFGELVATLDWLGYAGAWTVLDARFFGVAQRRRRVFLVAGLGAGFDPRALLFEPSGSLRHPPQSRTTSEDIAGTLGGGSGNRGWVEPREAFGGNVTSGAVSVASSLTANGSHRFDFASDTFVVEPVCVTGTVTHTLTAEGADASEDGTGRGTPIVTVPISFHHTQDPVTSTRVSFCLTRNADGMSVLDQHDGVRRLTPMECERLQGYPDGWTCLCGVQPYSSLTCICPDGPRYKACGNSVAVPVVQWIARNFARLP